VVQSLAPVREGSPGPTESGPRPASQTRPAGPPLAGVERFWNHNDPPPFYRAYATFEVFTDHTKVMIVCDHYARDGIGLAIEIDPSGAPAPIVYWDKNGPGNSCTSYTIGYWVRKWRFISVYQDGSIHNRAHPWEIHPLPWHDF
jgi:hypothetical protein